MDIHEHRRRRLRALIDADETAKGNVAEFARNHNQDAARVRQVLNPNYREGQSFGERAARRFEEELGLAKMYFDFGFAIEEHNSPQAGAQVTGQDQSLIKRLLPDDKGNVVTWERPEDLEPDEDRVWIDRYDYHFSAGTGLIQWEVRQKKALPFDIGFFKALGSKPKDCKLLTVRGDSMEPFLFNRDMMMVDSTRTHVRDGKVYAIYFEDEPLVKQVFKQVGGSIVLHSYNGKYPDREVPAESMELVKIVGEVIYRSGSAMAGGN
ncbi:S24 family peptidase [Paraburkholderia tagetis]|uniref:S24 family peptidase n=1 Tax=Paraburkholderia tagetis TaxID=2913261 RepID=A0A9X1UG93_9BURK|nr:S24 family peptidase [Paraburkholderia tagetis]MCG5072247.1 S24 family peptidase [Paraburkholderia tagetis]